MTAPGADSSNDNDVEQLDELDAPSDDGELLHENYPPSGNLDVPQQKRSDDPRPEHRLYITAGLLILVGLGSTATMLGAFLGSDQVWTRVERASTLVITPLLTLLGSAVGWFFGHRSGK